MDPRISIITPTFNRPQLLLRTLRCVQAQSFGDWEMLVVDDGDGRGRAAADSLGDVRIRSFQNPGKGQVDARNHALAHARGAIIQLLDDDDRWDDPEHLAAVVAEVTEHDGLLYRGGWLIREAEHADGWVETGRALFDPEASPEALRRDNLLLCSGVAYPRSLHTLLGGFDASLDHYWDWDWYLRVLAIRPMRRLGAAAVSISVRSDCASATPQTDDYVRFLQRLADKHGLEPLQPKNHLSLAST